MPCQLAWVQVLVKEIMKLKNQNGVFLLFSSVRKVSQRGPLEKFISSSLQKNCNVIQKENCAFGLNYKNED
jgi:hypothetical protein